jgi:hypothetical protein
VTFSVTLSLLKRKATYGVKFVKWRATFQYECFGGGWVGDFCLWLSTITGTAACGESYRLKPILTNVNFR